MLLQLTSGRIEPIRDVGKHRSRLSGRTLDSTRDGLKHHIRTVVATFAVVAVSVADAYAEVMDKEPSLTENWIWSLVGGLLSIVAWRWHWWAGLTVMSLMLLRLLGVYHELQDPFVGPAMRLEASEQYVTHFYVAVAVAVVLNAAGVYLRIRRGRAASQGAAPVGTARRPA